MSEVLCTRIALKSGSLPLIREWATKLNDHRRPEALATLIAEGVTVGSYFLESGPDGDYLRHRGLCFAVRDWSCQMRPKRK